MFSKSFLVKILLLYTLVSSGLSWRRRRRRRKPPPATDCAVSSWSSWGSCTKKCDIGTHTRYRIVKTAATYGGNSCPSLKKTEGCGATNGGCSHSCNSANGKCSCPPGYNLAGDQKKCIDINECLTSPCINSNCINSAGSYSCDCLPGYKILTKNQCSPKSCQPLTFPKCPTGAYGDVFGSTCAQVQAKCPDGLYYLETCALTCPKNYDLATIGHPSAGRRFAEDFATVDFNQPHDLFTCSWNAIAGKVSWDWALEKDGYYCRRVNDPPMGITISNSTMNERAPFLTIVGRFKASDPQDDNLMFTLENAKGNHLFLIQGDRLLVKTVLSWKSPATKHGNTYLVVVNATDDGSPPMNTQTRFNITVVNINDPPRDLELLNNEVSENVPVGTVVGNLSAIDDDISPQRSSSFLWDLVDSDNGFFSILGNQVTVAKMLDHEQRNVHIIKVRCTDFGKPRQTSVTSTLLVTVRNENDSPKSVNLTNVRVNENSGIGTVVGQVIATDQDNDTLLFSLNGTDQKVLDKFKLSGSVVCKVVVITGKAEQMCSINLIVVGSLDYEMKDEYVVWISITDPGGITQRKFKIKINDVNERPTGISLTSKRVAENSPGRTVGRFVVSDPDSTKGRLETHTCFLQNSDAGDEDAFIISQTYNMNHLQVKANKVLNFEMKNMYNINVTCKDTKLSLTKSFSIVVTDVNEKPTSLYLSSNKVEENSPDFTFVGQLSAQDPEGNNQTFVYTVTSSSSGNFFIGGTTQDHVLVNGSIDYEKTGVIDVNVRVTDSGGLHLEKKFVINVQNINDPPTAIILQSNSLPENSAQLVFIGTISLEDEDSNTKPSCVLLNSSNDRVVLDNLNLLVGPAMTDYESIDPKFLKILVNCSDGYGASITQWLKVNVEDVNESPTDLILSNSNVRENKNNSLVGILRIIDPDVNQRYNCYIFGNSMQNDSMFYIDTSTYPLTLRTAQPLDFESSKYHDVDIICEDNDVEKGQPKFIKEKQFTIHVIDVNEHPIIHCKTKFHVLTSSSNGSVIGQIEGYDPDNELYYKSEKLEQRKQLLNYRFEPENNTWPFDMTHDGILYIEGKLNEAETPIMFGVYVEDDGTVKERRNDSEEYHIKMGERKNSVHQCQVAVTSNATDKDITLSSNHVYENATYGTTIGQLSRKRSSSDESMSFHIINFEESPFVIDGDMLKVSSGESLDYELLGKDKAISVTVSSRSSKSGVFTKQFIIKIIDVNEKPLTICFIQPQPSDDCTVMGHILVEDPDYPELLCKNATGAVPKLSEYNCHVNDGEDILSNEINIMVAQKFRIKDLTLYANMNKFTQGNGSYKVPILCRSTIQPLHILTTTQQVPTPVCALCPEPNFCCLFHRGICIGKEYRINSTVDIPVAYFENEEFIPKFQEYIKSLMEKTSAGKTLNELIKEFDGQNNALSVRRRREVTPTFENVYVKLLGSSGDNEKTSVLFAVAEEKGQKLELISASLACKLLGNTRVQCQQDGETDRTVGGAKNGKEGFPMWIIIVIIAVAFVVFVVSVVIWRRRKSKRCDNEAVVRFANGREPPNFVAPPPGNSMYETAVDPTSYESQVVSLPAKKHMDPVLMEKRKDIKVFSNPMYHNPSKLENDSDSDHEDGESRPTANYYEKPLDAIYETVDDEFYEKVKEEVKVARTRSNPVYNVEEEDEDNDSLNPILNLALSPSKKVENSHETREEMSSFKYDDQQNILEKSHGVFGIANLAFSNGVETSSSQTPQPSSRRVNDNVYQLDDDEPRYASPAEEVIKEDDSSC